MHIYELPKEVLGLILDFLPQRELYQCAFVSSYFYSCTISALWRTLDLTDPDRLHRLSTSITTSRKRLGHNCHILFLENVNDDQILFLICNMPNLERLEVRRSELVSDTSICSLPQHCSQLKELFLEDAVIGHRSAHHLGSCNSLRELTLHNCQHLIPISLLPFADCPLEILDLKSCKWLNAEDTAYDLRAFRQLKHLGLMCCQELTSQFFQRLIEDEVALPELQFLSITNGTGVSEDAIISFIQSHPKLESIHFLQCPITDRTLRAIAICLPNVRAIDISYCQNFSAEAVRALIRSCTQLMMIGLWRCGIQQSVFPELVISESNGESPSDCIYTLGYFELEKIREALSQPSSPLNSPPPRNNAYQRDSNVNNSDESLRETYGYIQAYMNRI